MCVTRSNFSDNFLMFVMIAMLTAHQYDSALKILHVYSVLWKRKIKNDDSETWPTNVGHELKLNHTEMSMIRWMCRVKLNERKKSEELRELLGLEQVSLMIKKSRLRWFGHVKRKDDNDWVKCCITWKVEGIRQSKPEKDLVGLC